MNCKEVFHCYCSLLSKEMRSTIVRYEKLPITSPLPDSAFRKGAIRVVFDDNSWVRVYQSNNGGIEWY